MANELKNTNVTGTLAVSGTSTLTGNVSAGGALAVTGASTLTGAVTTGSNLKVGGCLAIGTATPSTSYLIDCRDASAATSGSRIAANYGVFPAPASASSAAYYGFMTNGSLQSAQSCPSGAVIGFVLDLRTGVTGSTLGALIGVQSRTYNLGAGTVTSAYGVSVDTTGTTGIIQNWYGIDITANTNATANAVGSTAKYGIRIGDISGGATSYSIYTGSGAVRLGGDLTVVGDAAINGGDLNSSSSTFNLLASPTTLNIGAAATTVSIGKDNTSTINLKAATIASGLTSLTLFNTTATTVNAFGAGTTIRIGAATGTTTINNSLTITGALTANGNITLGDASTDSITCNGRLIVRAVTDAGPMTATNGTAGEIVRNTSDNKFYGCTVTGTPATWVALN